MGKDPQTSVLNGYCQAREVKNLFVTDGAFLRPPARRIRRLPLWQLSMRTADYIKEQRRRGEL